MKISTKDTNSQQFLPSVCLVPLGMQSGAIVDSQISASSVYNSNHGTHQARLHLKASGQIRGGWSSKVNDINQWLQVDLQQTRRVTRIATQGRNGFSPGQWATKYKLQYGEDGHYFKFYRRIGAQSDTVRFFIELLNCQGFSPKIRLHTSRVKI